MSAGAKETTPPAQEATKFTVCGLPLEKYFDRKNRGMKVTRGEMRDLMMLLASKAAMQEAMQVLAHGLRADVKRAVAAEMANVLQQIADAQDGERRTEGGIILQP